MPMHKTGDAQMTGTPFTPQKKDAQKAQKPVEKPKKKDAKK
jgi:hypothetical protein